MIVIVLFLVIAVLIAFLTRYDMSIQSIQTKMCPNDKRVLKMQPHPYLSNVVVCRRNFFFCFKPRIANNVLPFVTQSNQLKTKLKFPIPRLFPGKTGSFLFHLSKPSICRPMPGCLAHDATILGSHRK